MKNYFYDDQHVRYQLVKSSTGYPYNWLFFRGGPGADSSYLKSLIDTLDNLPGNLWLVDLPSNGSNIIGTLDPNYDFKQWFQLLPDIVRKFENPIVVGHSFGGMLPFYFPELESILKGLVCIGTPIRLDADIMQQCVHDHRLPDFTPAMMALIQNPTDENFENVLEGCLPYYFSQENIDYGRAALQDTIFNYYAVTWWPTLMQTEPYDAKWIPQTVPTLMITGNQDSILPFALNKQDQRLQRSNIEIAEITDAGHLPWVEQSEMVMNVFKKFQLRLHI